MIYALWAAVAALSALLFLSMRKTHNLDSINRDLRINLTESIRRLVKFDRDFKLTKDRVSSLEEDVRTEKGVVSELIGKNILLNNEKIKESQKYENKINALKDCLAASEKEKSELQDEVNKANARKNYHDKTADELRVKNKEMAKIIAQYENPKNSEEDEHINTTTEPVDVTDETPVELPSEEPSQDEKDILDTETTPSKKPSGKSPRKMKAKKGSVTRNKK